MNNPNKQSNPASEQILAKLLRAFDEQRRGSKGSAELHIQEDLSPHDAAQLRAAGEFLNWLDEAGPDAQLETQRPRSTFNPNAENASAIPTDPFDAGRFFEMPQRIGRFDIVDRLGQGGFGIVFRLRAHDPQLGRDVALKVPRPESLISEHARERFLREAHTAAILSHPAIVPIFESGQAGPVTFIAYEYCQGTTLHQWLDDYPPPIDVRLAAKMVAHLADAVQHAHSRGVIHRDLKPGNVILDTDEFANLSDDELVASLRVTDFGLAQSELADQQSLTQTGAPLGTPAYMSPEQASGQKNVGPASDIYSLGAMLYQLLTGSPPHRKDNHLSTLQAIGREQPKSIRKQNARVPRDLEAICLKCLEKEPKQRYPNAHAFAEDLECFLQGRATTARPVGSLTHFVRWCARNPVVSGMSFLAIASLLVGLMLVSWQWRQAQRYLIESQQQGRRAELHLARTEESIDKMYMDVAKVLRNLPKMSPLRERLLGQALVLQQQILEQEKGDRANLRVAKAHRRMGEIQIQLGKTQLAQQHFSEALQVLGQLPAGTSDQREFLLEKGRNLRLAGHMHYARNDQQLALQSADEAIAALELADQLASDSASSSELSSAHRMRGMSLQRQQQMADAVAAFQQSVDLLAGYQQPDQHQDCRAELARAHNSLAVGLKANGEMEKARLNYQKSIEYADSMIGDHPERIDLKSQMASTALNLGNLWFFEQDYDQAAKFYELSADTFEILANDFPTTVSFLRLASSSTNGLGTAYRRTDQLELAIECYERAIDLLNRLDQPNLDLPHSQMTLCRTYGNLAIVQNDLQQFDDARQSYTTAIDLARKLTEQYPAGDEYFLTHSMALGNYAGFLIKLDELDNVETLFVQAVDLAKRAIHANPKQPSYLRNGRWQYRELAKAKHLLRQHNGIIDLANDWIQLKPESPDFHKYGVYLLIVALEQVDADTTLDSDKKSEVKNMLANQAIDLVQRAEGQDLLTAAELADDPKFESLTKYPRFEDLIGD